MNIGDRVRFLHSIGEGIVSKVLSNNMIEVEIEDNFKIPYPKKELVLVQTAERRVFGSDSTPSSKVISSEGIFIGFAGPDNQLSVHLINNTDYDMLFTLGEEKQSVYTGLRSSILPPKSQMLVHHRSMQNFEVWPVYIVQSLLYREGKSEIQLPSTKRLVFKASSFMKSRTMAPVLYKEVYLTQIDTNDVKHEIISEKTIEKSVAALQNKWQEGTLISTSSKPAKPSKEIDLHIEKLSSEVGLNNTRILQIQIELFEKSLDSAIANNMDEIIFIHGIGNGILKKEIHKRLATMKHIKFFQDAQKEKFGYGATLVRLK